MNTLVTVIIAVYNGEKYLSECIESVLNQTYKNLEIILVNDGSTDGSAEIIKKYEEKDRRIITIHKENSGVSLSRNAALDIATGEYICILDQDDLFAPDYVEYYLDLIKQSGAEVALTPKAVRFTEYVSLKQCSEKREYCVLTGKEAAIQMLYYKFIIAPWNKMISRELIEENQIQFDSRFFSGEGFLFSIECLQKALKVAVGQQCIYYYRIDNAESGMTKYRESVIRSSISAQDVIEKKICDRTDDILQACHYANWHTHCDCLNTFVGCNAIGQNKILYKEIKQYCKKNAKLGFSAPISYKEKFKAFLYWLNPYLGARFINMFRKRKFTKME